MHTNALSVDTTVLVSPGLGAESSFPVQPACTQASSLFPLVLMYQKIAQRMSRMVKRKNAGKTALTPQVVCPQVSVEAGVQQGGTGACVDLSVMYACCIPGSTPAAPRNSPVCIVFSMPTSLQPTFITRSKNNYFTDRNNTQNVSDLAASA